jgi:hypothetical protein
LKFAKLRVDSGMEIFARHTRSGEIAFAAYIDDILCFYLGVLPLAFAKGAERSPVQLSVGQFLEECWLPTSLAIFIVPVSVCSYHADGVR